MFPITAVRQRHAFALVELVVALAIGMVVLAGAYAVLRSQQRFYHALAATLEVHQGSRAAAQILAAELVALDPPGGDLVALGPDSISIRAARLLTFVCAPPDAAAARLVVRDTLTYGFRGLDPARDRLLVYRGGGADTGHPRAWLDAAVSRVRPGASCADGAPGTALDLAGAAGLDEVSAGAPVRSYERTIYRLYADAEGRWWLGVRAWSDAGWSATSPVAGPLQPRVGVELRYHDARGATTGDPTRVARIDVVVRGLSGSVIQESGGRQRRYADSVATAVTPRNGSRTPAP
jgi:hypothetical protein